MNIYYFNGVPLVGLMTPALGAGELVRADYVNKMKHFYQVDFSKMTQDEITAMLVSHRMEDGSNS